MYLYQKPRKSGDRGTVYAWTPTLAGKSGMVEISDEAGKRILAGEDANLVLAPTDMGGMPEVPADHVLLVVPKAIADDVRKMVYEYNEANSQIETKTIRIK